MLEQNKLLSSVKSVQWVNVAIRQWTHRLQHTRRRERALR